jgi:hypothetical protein
MLAVAPAGVSRAAATQMRALAWVAAAVACTVKLVSDVLMHCGSAGTVKLLAEPVKASGTTVEEAAD